MSAMKHFEQQSYYELLEVPVTASEDQILDAYARAMETYSPDSIAVYTLAEPEALDALRERLTQAMEVLCALEQRLEYDRKIGVKRSPEELARLRAESLKRAAEAPAGKAPADGAGEAPVTEAAAQAQPVAEVKPALQAVPAAEEEPQEAEVVTGEVVVEVEPVAEAKPAAPESAAEPLAAEAPPEPAAAAAAAPDAAPTPEAVPVVPLAAKPGSLSRSLTPAPTPGLKPAIHARPMTPVARRGSALPPPLPPRNGARAIVRAEAEPTPPAPAPAPAPRPGDSRTRLKTVVDVPPDAEFNGELLRQVREGRNLSLHMLADRTRISSRHVESIEADRYDILPASVYLRGMLMSIARELGLDPLRVSRSYMGLVAAGEKKNR
ncbi:helix-turn-helix domain-containing protein [Archangium gephyra]|uniref:helix-turn-helix domain-containing protein n=1 Tax=Archangium gephyra TaxID=48 RepID=UPI003B7E6033